MSTFESFLKDCLDHGHTQIKLVPRRGADDVISFYATGQGGETCGDFDGSVEGDGIAGPVVIAADEEAEAAPKPAKKKKKEPIPSENFAGEEVGLDFGNGS